MQVGRVFVEGVDVGKRHRTASPEKVKTLADSMKAIGLQQPISVWSPDDDTCDLVAGLHRLEAAKLLGWEEIDCVFVDMDEVERELWEIAENLHRVDLTKEERDRQIRRYAELIELRATKLKVGQSDPLSAPISKKGGRGNEGLASKVAEETGLSKRTVNRVLNPAPPKPPVEYKDADEEQFDALCRAWNRASTKARGMFDEWREENETPVMDQAS